MLRKYILILLTLGLAFQTSKALPQFSLLSGNKCQNCHINSQGGGARSDLGWYSFNEQSLIKPESVGLGWLYGKNDAGNTLLDSSSLTVGTDMRFQSVRSHAADEASRKYFPMQTEIYASIRATKWMQFEGGINIGHQRFGNTKTSNYRGQQPWSLSMILQPTVSYPQLRVGFFRPTIGMRNDDHTKLIWQVPSAAGTSNVTNLIPPLYAEFGAEITYDAIKWLTISVGAFGSHSISELRVSQYDIGGSTPNFISLISGANKPTAVARAMIFERFMDDKLNTYLGSSIFTNDDFMLVNAFAGVGLADKVTLMIDYAVSDKKGIRSTNTASIEALYQLDEALFLTARAETGRTLTENSTPAYTQTVMLGAQIFILPYIEFRPEYRVMDANTFRSGRYAFQLHIFY
ncbi:MAG: hypothetical protein HYZ54_04825 [Ignavibacteriae bacterium]|nr:hypothetical protein [Ignavibacteriota bacterium]